MTVGEQRANIKRYLDGRGGNPKEDDFYAAKLVALGQYDDDMPLWTLHDALEGDVLDEGQKFIVRWQRRHDYIPSHFEEAFFTLISTADEGNLVRLSYGWPDEVAALRGWREDPEYSRGLRLLPFDFDL